MPAKAASHANGRSFTAYPWATLDRVIVVTYAIFFTIGVFVDYVNAYSKCAWHWPPRVVWQLYFWWCEHADPVLQLNPLWIKYLSVLSPVVFCPFYLASIYAITRRRDWIRIPSIMYASVLFVDLSAFFVEGVWGELPSPNMALFALGYGYYQLFPLLLLYRFWADDPFCKQQTTKQRVE